MSVTLVTSHGKLKFEIYCEDCPVTSKNFLALCSSGFYNNCLFHFGLYHLKAIYHTILNSLIYHKV